MMEEGILCKRQVENGWVERRRYMREALRVRGKYKVINRGKERCEKEKNHHCEVGSVGI